MIRHAQYFILILFSRLHCGLNPTNNLSTIKLKGPNAKLIMNAPINDFSGTLEIEEMTESSIVQTTTNDKLLLKAGQIKTDQGEALVTGSFSTQNGGQIILDGNQTVDLSDAVCQSTLEISGTGNKITGKSGETSPINLYDANTEAELRLIGKLGAPINLNGGKITLTQDLNLKDNIHVDGDGTIDLNNFTLTLPVYDETPWTGELIFDNANDTYIRRYTTLTGRWRYRKGTSSNLYGVGAILDISGGGEIRVENSHILRITGLHIKGLGDAKGFFNVNSTAQIRLSNVTLELDEDYTFNQGTIIIEGDNCNIISTNNSKFYIGGTAQFNIDGVVLTYDSLSEALTTGSPLQTINTGQVNLLNHGQIRSKISSGTSSSSELKTEDLDGSNTTERDVILDSNSTLNFKNSVPANSKNMRFDAKGNKVSFNDGSNQPFVVEENVNLTVENVIMENFDPNQIQLKGSGGTRAKLKFGQNSRIKFKKNIQLNSDGIEVEGDTTIESEAKSEIEIESQKLKVSNDKTLTIKGTRVKTKAYDAIQCDSDNASIILENSDLFISSTGLDMGRGNLKVRGKVHLQGQDDSTPGSKPKLNFLSKGHLTVESGSNLSIKEGTTFNYSPDTSDDTGDTNLEKRHILLSDPSSSITVNQATIQTGSTGLALDYGKLLIKGKATFEVDPTAGKELELGSALEVDVYPGAILEITGPVKHTVTTY